MNSRDERFIFRSRDTIGVAAAEDDREFLATCFVDTGDLASLVNCNDPRSLVLGRTGSGKTALLREIVNEQVRAIEIKPESLALAYISNSTILSFIAQLGVRLDIFFKLLWRHVFTVEIIKQHFKITSEVDQRTFFDRIANIFRNAKHLQALHYLEVMGSDFLARDRLSDKGTNYDSGD